MNALDGIGIDSALAAEAERKAAEDEVGQSQFLEMLVAQLENQDPLNPQDSAQFAAQLAQFSTVEQLVAVRAGIDELVAMTGTNPLDTGAAGALDPTSLVGREVVVFGSQIEVDANRSLIEMPYRTIDQVADAKVRIYDADGQLRREQSIQPLDENGDPVALRPGDHVFRFDPNVENLESGVYAIEFSGKNAAGEDVTILPMVEGVVTGAILAGEPSIRMGSRVFPVVDILEVRLAPQAAAQAGVSTAQVGGGQTVYGPSSGRPPQPFGY